MTEHAAAEFWDARYAVKDQIWSGRPNRALVDAVTGLAPGRALDLGCGEGGDCVWLAEQGWQVTAVDISATAVARAQAAAALHGLDDGRITWVVDDLAAWRPPALTFGLVSACFLQSPLDFPRADVLRAAASAVAPGGHLLVVSHAEPPPWAGPEHRHHRFPTVGDELDALALEAGEWGTIASDRRARSATGPDGESATLNDNVIFVRRR